MRFLNTKTKTLEATVPSIDRRDRTTRVLGSIFPSNNLEKRFHYAILSHRWLEGEIQFHDLSRPDVAQMQGYAKLSAACDTARRLGFKYLWMDTCCIDKSSSSELSESINSMYAWYQEAALCIVYLDDVRRDAWRYWFGRAKWFTRGWTLQELIAPREAVFFAKDWNIIGTKTSLATRIADMTGIDEHVLLTGDMDGICAARKMSWAAERATTRPEDRAYSLMGIFGVNMPTIYGEGDRAFIRLQEEIMKISTDQSIFAWGGSSPRLVRGQINLTRHSRIDDTSLLAPSPAWFQWGHDMVQIPFALLEKTLHVQDLDEEFTQTNRGVRIRLSLQLIDETANLWMAYLACGDRAGTSIFAMFLRQVTRSRFTRVVVMDPLDVKLSKVPLDAIPIPNVNPQVVFIASHDLQFPDRERLTREIQGLETRILLVELRGHLRRWRLTLFDESWSHKADEHGRLLFYDLAHPDPTHQEMFLFAKDDSQVVQFMLVVTLNAKPSQKGSQVMQRIDVRAISVGSDGDIPESMLERPPRDVYETWRKTAPPIRLSESPQFPVVKLSNGVEIGFVLVPSDRFWLSEWFIWAIPSTSVQHRRAESSSDHQVTQRLHSNLQKGCAIC